MVASIILGFKYEKDVKELPGIIIDLYKVFNLCKNMKDNTIKIVTDITVQESIESLSSSLYTGVVSPDIISFISKSELPKQDPDQVKAAQAQKQQEAKVTASKEEVGSSLGNQSAHRAAVANSRATSREPVMPRKSEKMYGRNDKVSVKYVDGKIKKDVKYKSVEQDLSDSRCVIIEG